MLLIIAVNTLGCPRRRSWPRLRRARNLSGIRRVYIDYEQDEKDNDLSIQIDRYWLTILSDQGEYKYVFDVDPQDMKVLQDALGDRVHGEGRAKVMKPKF